SFHVTGVQTCALPIYFLFGEARAGRDLDLLLLTGAQILRLHVHDAVGVDVEGYLYLRHAAGSGGDTHEVEAAERAVVRRELALTDRKGGGEGTWAEPR